MLVFILLLAEGLVWAWHRGHLEWTDERHAPDHRRTNATSLRRHGILLTSLEELYNWGRSHSVWPLQFGLACCAIEMIAASMARFDIARFGSEVFRPSPRQADLLIVSGTVTKKMAPQVVRLWNQMPEPKYCIAMGACAISGGPFKQGYNVLKGIDRFIPVDVYIPGCPPRPRRCCTA
jgi:NADH-quinone oxidoreductase subunit B